jgi:undecaprenyl diphosphate synthase
LNKEIFQARVINAKAMGNDSVPSHIGFIMDGNRRWARAHGLPSLEGHRRGYARMKEVGDWCLKRGIKNVTVFAFSTENWQRSKEEVDYLMQLIHRAFTAELHEFDSRGIKLKIIGRREGLPQMVQQAADEAEQHTAGNTKGTLYVALNYGGRAEIVDAIKIMLAAKTEPSAVDDSFVRQFLYAPEAPDPDLIIRTSGEQRLSGFLLWPSAYSELYFISKHWPDFSEEDLNLILTWYADRERRFGK